MPALQNVEEWEEREDEEEIMSIIEREEREKQKEMDMQEREDRILRERREEEESSEDEAEPDIRRQITDEREPITMEGNRGMLLGEPIVSPNYVYKWAKDNITTRWSNRLGVAAQRGDDDGVLVLKSTYNTAWNYFKARELGDTILNTWRDRIERIERLSTAPNNMSVLYGDIPPSEVDNRLLMAVETPVGPVGMLDTRTIGILNRRTIVSKKRTKNLFDMTGLWKKIVLRKFDEDSVFSDQNVPPSDSSAAGDDSDGSDIDPQVFIDMVMGTS
ncbi:uncharacterized protein BT62DRAFT_1014089 [Guyanagaster necrorhizus]|uniref:Uncharacterized protein n=1 Tax=Guyanagaster necrorhizus TaxID=856835 RepID=A0A9P7VEC1_9AGAR|nr:uncharacterized protein BT62DRAFT_1014089 [Guyanagaster necrorhizus MCA 3950]KAG7439348.1 hypothetical protein BT62DRAFT_1014089 [Guyanagaster necrorhizus MCA 3950]